mmetsp:Transcript_80235/g.232964  ORF Transcript_80235/g.232964 Transcript_80235/m.232964 type:complete len:253 (+) Transcript_80235:1766-2524(+)
MLLLDCVFHRLKLVLLQGEPVDLGLLLLDQLLELRDLLGISIRFLLLCVDLVLPAFNRLPKLLEVAVQLFLAAQLLLRFLQQLIKLPFQTRQLAAVGGFLRLHLLDLRVQVRVLLLQLNDLTLQHVPVLDQVVLLLHQLIDHVLLIDAQTGALLHEPPELGDLRLQVLDRLLRALLLLVRRLDHLPRSLDLALEGGDCGLVLLRQLQRRLHLHRILHNLGVELSAFLDQLLLALVGLLQCAVQFLILRPEVL